MKKLLLSITLLTLLSLSTKAQLTTLLNLNFINNGVQPRGSLISDGTYLYGMTLEGGSGGFGVLFKIKPDGTAYSSLLNFNGGTGSQPWGSLITDGTYLYGMTSLGTNNTGLIFKIKPDGTGYTDLYNFPSISTGENETYGSLITDGTYLYGMTYNISASGYGNVFKIKTDGTAYTDLLDFNGSNGKNPYGSLISDGTYLYGMTSASSSSNGLIFKIKTDGTGYADILNTNGSPYGSLLSDGTYLYGMTSNGGTHGDGLVFKVKPDGTGYADLLDFNGTNGKTPFGSLISDGTYLYGMTVDGGTHNDGVLFKIKPDGTGYTDLADFNGTNGENPYGDLLFIGGKLYGMTNKGGTNNDGTIFEYAQPAAALNFDGLNDYVSTSVFSTLTNNLTMEAAVNWSGSTSANQMILSNGSTGGSGYTILVDHSNGDKLSALLGGVTFMQSNAQLTAGVWHMVSLVCNSGTWTLYLDGVPYTLTNNTSVPNAVNGTFNIGANQSGGENFNGSIDEVRFWSRALCPGEIQHNMLSEVADNASGLL